MAASLDGEKMDAHFAVFNLHCNNAGKRANAAFRKKYGTTIYKREIAPKHKEGIMSIFSFGMTRYQREWVRMVRKFVNETRT
jgi:hypothetical protein